MTKNDAIRIALARTPACTSKEFLEAALFLYADGEPVAAQLASIKAAIKDGYIDNAKMIGNKSA